MKSKLFLSLLLVTTFFFSSFTYIHAACDAVNVMGGGVGNRAVACWQIKPGAFYSCDTDIECRNIINGIAPPPGGVVPFNQNAAAPMPTCIAPDGTKGINTALGCISYDATKGGFVQSLLTIIIGLGGGVALLLILYGVFIVTSSAGIPEKLKSGNEIITSAVAGLLFIIMAIFLMNLIGIKILALPGLQ